MTLNRPGSGPGMLRIIHVLRPKLASAKKRRQQGRKMAQIQWGAAPDERFEERSKKLALPKTAPLDLQRRGHPVSERTRSASHSVLLRHLNTIFILGRLVLKDSRCHPAFICRRQLPQETLLQRLLLLPSSHLHANHVDLVADAQPTRSMVENLESGPVASRFCGDANSKALAILGLLGVVQVLRHPLQHPLVPHPQLRQCPDVVDRVHERHLGVAALDLRHQRHEDVHVGGGLRGLSHGDQHL
mmetsp:Transcript_73528/g.239264  ORF Transcript_73528/g.239264 Transcript_73528/m.239264 type:complete len:244 (-) Transcript_73528:725-1456(-)